jgi:hypothetical protein
MTFGLLDIRDDLLTCSQESDLIQDLIMDTFSSASKLAIDQSTFQIFRAISVCYQLIILVSIKNSEMVIVLA